MTESLEARRRAAQLAFDAGSAILGAGAQAAGDVLQGELLRAVHACRAAGLHRAAGAGVRVVQMIRDLREERPELNLESLASELFELLRTSAMIARAEDVGAEWIGTARRAYAPIGDLRAFGLFTEAVVTASGYAGVSTRVCDAEGRLYSISDVMPAPAERAPFAYEAGMHRRLGRSKLWVHNATASDDGRLGGGAKVKIVMSETSAWTDEGPSRLFAPSLAEQLELAWSDGQGLLFFSGKVRGASKGALILDAGGILLRAVAASDHEELEYRDNLRLLSRARGLSLRAIGEVRRRELRTIELLAIEPDPARVKLPASWHGRVNLGLDRLNATYFAGTAEVAELDQTEDAPPPLDPLIPLTRRLVRVAFGGRRTLGPEVLDEVQREAAVLERRQMPGTAELLRALPKGPLAERWIEAMIHTRAAAAAIARARWLC